MRGLLIKDWCVLYKQMKIFLVMMLLFAAAGGHFLQGFALMYCGLFPLTLLAFDEQSGWGRYAAMMPYTPRDLVLSKYLIGLFAVGITGGVAVASALTRTLFAGGSLSGFSQRGWILCILLFAAVLMLNLYLPLVYKWGVEKGRFFYILLGMGAAGAVVSLLDDENVLAILNTKTILAIVALAAVLTLPWSLRLSEKAYRRRNA